MRFRLMNFCLCVMLFIALLPGTACAEEAKEAKLHTPAEIRKIMEESDLTYTFMYYGGPGDKKTEPFIFPPGRFRLVEGENGEKKVVEYEYSQVVKDCIAGGDSLFKEKMYAEAMARYREALSVNDGYYHPALTCMGNVFFALAQYDSAAACFEAAIGGNFMDYQPHWFLADTYASLGRIDDVLAEMTTAHLLNRNHKPLHKQLKYLRKELGHPWKSWAIGPRYEVFERDGKIVISADPDWLGYAMVKAVWQYEPGYSEMMTGVPSKSRITSNMEEKEAMLAYLAIKEDERISKIIEDGFFDEFVLYEIIAKRAPIAMPLLPKESFDRVVEYVGRYH